MYPLLTVIFGGVSLVLVLGGYLLRWGMQLGRDAERLDHMEELTKTQWRIGDLEDVLEEQVLHRPYVTRFPEHQTMRMSRPKRLRPSYIKHDDDK